MASALALTAWPPLTARGFEGVPLGGIFEFGGETA